MASNSNSRIGVEFANHVAGFAGDFSCPPQGIHKFMRERLGTFTLLVHWVAKRECSGLRHGSDFAEA
eukprot:5056707-Lingulodinium_polyedra.AAC.1